ncbi:hypothetical protein ACXNSR_12140 [Streptomyces sp. NC-S4]
MTDDAQTGVDSTTDAVGSSNQPLIFVSHDSRDAKLAEAFSKLLSNVSAGMLKSFRSSDNKGPQGLEYGSDWYPEIVKRITAASDVVCLLTNRSINRPWILYEAGLAKGKLNAPVHCLALGVPLNKASAGPFAQFQNCGDDVDSLTKLTIQLVKRLPSAAPERDMVSAQVEVFGRRVREILSSVDDGAVQEGELEDSSNARIFEEIKLMFQELPLRMEQSVMQVGLHPLHTEFLDISVLGEIVELVAGDRHRPGVAYLILASPFREVMPWLYEIAVEIYRAEVRGDFEAAAKGRADFMSALRVSSRLPVVGFSDFREFSSRLAQIISRFDEIDPRSEGE